MSPKSCRAAAMISAACSSAVATRMQQQHRNPPLQQRIHREYGIERVRADQRERPRRGRTLWQRAQPVVDEVGDFVEAVSAIAVAQGCRPRRLTRGGDDRQRVGHRRFVAGPGRAITESAGICGSPACASPRRRCDLPGLLREVEEQRRIAREFLQAGLAIAVGVEGRLEATQRDRAVGEHFAAPLDRLGLQPWYGATQLTRPISRACRRRLAAQEPDLAPFFWPTIRAM